MINEMKQLLHFELIRLGRDRINFVFIFALIGLAIYGLWTESVTALYGFRALHQLSMFFAVFAGYRFAKTQEKKGIKEWIDTLPYQKKRNFPQLISLYLFSLFIVFILLILVTCSYLLNPIQLNILFETYVVILLHYLLPMLVATTFGWCIGKSINGILGYFVAGLIGFLFGSFGMQLYLPYVVNNAVLNSISPLFGFDSTGVLYSALSGYDLSFSMWVRPILWLSLSLLISSQIGTKNKANGQQSKLSIFFIASTAILLLVAIAFTPNRNTLIESVSTIEKMDNEVYIDQENEVPLQEPNFHWKNLHLDVQRNGMDLFVKGSGDLVLDQDVSTLAFNLQQNFKVLSWKINQMDMNFNQVGDVITMETSGKSGDAFNIEFSYEGRPHGKYLTNESSIILTANYQWVPSPFIGQSILFRNGKFASVIQRNSMPIDYSLNVENNEPFWSNILGGEAKKSIDLIFGRINTQEIDGISYVYTNLDPVEIQRATKPVIEGINELRQQLGLESEPIQTVISFSELSLTSIGDYTSNAQLIDNTLLRRYGTLLYPPLEEPNATRDEEFFRYEIMSAILASEPAFLYQGSEMQTAFLNGYVMIFAPYAAKYVPYPELVTFLENADDPMAFIALWHNQLLENKEFTKEDLFDLMEKYQ